MWHYRQFTADDAARMCGLPRGHLDIIIHRNKPVATLFSEKRGGRRWFSLCDIAVLRVAFELEQAGRNWLTAIGTAFDNLEEKPPPEDALLVAPAVRKRGCGRPRIISDRDIPRLPLEASTVIVPIGRITKQITEAANGLAV